MQKHPYSIRTGVSDSRCVSYQPPPCLSLLCLSSISCRSQMHTQASLLHFEMTTSCWPINVITLWPRDPLFLVSKTIKSITTKLLARWMLQASSLCLPSVLDRLQGWLPQSVFNRQTQRQTHKTIKTLLTDCPALLVNKALNILCKKVSIIVLFSQNSVRTKLEGKTSCPC